MGGLMLWQQGLTDRLLRRFLLSFIHHSDSRLSISENASYFLPFEQACLLMVISPLPSSSSISSYITSFSSTCSSCSVSTWPYFSTPFDLSLEVGSGIDKMKTRCILWEYRTQIIYSQKSYHMPLPPPHLIETMPNLVYDFAFLAALYLPPPH